MSSHYEINVATRTDKPLDGYGPHWVHEMKITLPVSTTLRDASLKVKELNVLLNSGGVQRQLSLTRHQETIKAYTQEELDACHVMGRWPTY